MKKGRDGVSSKCSNHRLRMVQSLKYHAFVSCPISYFYFSFHMKTADIHTRLTINHYLLAFVLITYVSTYSILYPIITPFFWLKHVKTNYYDFHVQEGQETMVFTP